MNTYFYNFSGFSTWKEFSDRSIYFFIRQSPSPVHILTLLAKIDV